MGTRLYAIFAYKIENGRVNYEIIEASSPEQIATIRALFREYEASIETDLCFQGFERELAELPGEYAPPRGTLLLALADGEVAGCIALRSLEDGCCEMKRLYVRPAFRGTGLGGALARRVIADAARIGYRAIRLDTLPSMETAIAMYRALGFQEIASYRYNPVPGALYFERALP